MKNSILGLVAVAFFTSLLHPTAASAAHPVAIASATMQPVPTRTIVDNRAKILQTYLEKNNSPLAPYAEMFVAEADKNDIDWRLLVAISGLESNHGKRIPINSYNAWGWGIYGANIKRFTSWEEAIQVISHDLRHQYMDKWRATTIYQIGKFYASSPTWASRVIFFVHNIDKVGADTQIASLSISL